MTKMSKSEIETNLKNAGVTSDISFKYDYNSASKDKCFKQSKSGDVSSKDIDKLKFYISWGKKDKYVFKLPNLKDKNLDEAKSVMDKLNKKYKCKIKLTTKDQVISESVAKGDIISQEPKSGKKYNSNSKDKNIPKKEKVPKKVSIVVSLGHRHLLLHLLNRLHLRHRSLTAAKNRISRKEKVRVWTEAVRKKIQVKSQTRKKQRKNQELMSL